MDVEKVANIVKRLKEENNIMELLSIAKEIEDVATAREVILLLRLQCAEECSHI